MLPVTPKPKKRNYHITSDEVKVLYDIARSFGEKWEIFILIAVTRGLRLSEILYLNKDDFISPDCSRFKVIFCKSHIGDVLPLHPLVADRVKVYIEKNQHSFRNGFLFSWYTGRNDHGCMKKQTASAMMHKFRKKAIEMGYTNFGDYWIMKNGLRRWRISTHSLRRFHESQIYRLNGNDAVLVKDIMRYTRLSSIEPYVKSLDMYEKEQIILKNTWDNFLEFTTRYQKINN